MPASPIDADAELRARFQSLCRANGIDQLFAAERSFESAWSATPVQVWRSELFNERCKPEEDRLVMAKPIGRVGVWSAIFEDDFEEMAEQSHAVWLATDHAAVAAASAAEREAWARKNKAERVACRDGFTRTKTGAVAQRIAEPCKFLYSCQGTPARPTTNHVSSECWSHAEGVCVRAHPGDALWQPQWMADRRWKPSGAAAAPAKPAGRFASLGGVAPAPKPSAAAPWAKPSAAAPSYKYGRLRPGGKFDNSSDEAEARSEWIESQKDRGRHRDY
jgi:hypothetical protein